MVGFNIDKFYKHPQKLISEGATVNWVYAMLNEYATSEKFVMTNPFLLATLLADKEGRKGGGNDVKKFKESLQFLVNNNYIELYTLTHKGLNKTVEYSFVDKGNTTIIKSTDNICVRIVDLKESDVFIKAYHIDIEKMMGIKWSDACKMLMVYLAIMKEAYKEDVVTVPFSDLRTTTGIKTNVTISKIVGLLKEHEILNKTNKFIGYQEGCYRYVRYHNSHLIGNEEALERENLDRENRNAKRKYATFGLAKAEDLFGADDEVIEETNEDYSKEHTTEEFPYDFKVYNKSCPLDSYISVSNNAVDFYIDNCRRGGGSYEDVSELMISKNVLENENSFIHRLAKDNGSINIVLKEAKSELFLEKLHTLNILKNVVMV